VPEKRKWENDMRNLTLAGLAAAIMAIGVVGCTQEAREDYSEAGQRAQMATEKTGEAIKTDAQATGEAVKDAAQETKEAADNSMMTGQVRVALSGAHDLQIDDLNVDTVDNKIVLKGTVHSEDAKKRAGEIARGMAGNDFGIDNQLEVVK
jgi:osmotically-inducible protein OsmY